MTTRLYTFAAVTFLAGLFFLWRALQLPGSHEVSTLVGPRTWPMGVLILMLGLVGAMVGLLRAKGPAQFTEETGADDPATDTADAAVKRDTVAGAGWRHLVVLGLTIGYTVVMTVTGYLIATALFAAATTVVLGERRPLRIGLNTLIAVLIVSVVFDRLLNIPLP